jgi:hypothetical protein
MIVGVPRLVDRFAGSAIALCFISTSLTLVRRFVRAAEREEQDQEAQELKRFPMSPSRPADLNDLFPLVGE